MGIPRARGRKLPGRAVVYRTGGDSPRARTEGGKDWSAFNLVRGFPARADGSRVCISGRTGSWGIPRARGRKPQGSLFPQDVLGDSPRARTEDTQRLMKGEAVGGFPARADGSRIVDASSMFTEGIPRARGRKPSSSPPSQPSVGDSPRARTEGSSACAHGQ